LLYPVAMDGRQSAYAELGLRPGADRAQIEEAYRRLIKLYHPDRAGGDGGRAAEITRAYRELRDRPSPLPVRVQPDFQPALRRRKSRLPLVLILFAAVVAMLGIGRTTGLFRLYTPPAAAPPMMAAAREDGSTSLPTPLDDLEEPLSKSAIDRSAADALRLYSQGSAASLAGYSRACQSQFRNHPDVVWFDTCSAYDEAVVLLQSRDPIADSGPFNPTAVTGREMGEAGLLSDDSLAADSRLHKIRSRVELVLLSATSQ
jgi:hypothetical protein